MKLKDFVIPFVGLSEGVHEFQFQVDKGFFDVFPIQDVEVLEASVEMQFEKKSTMLVIHLTMEGLAESSCWRCNAPIQIPLHGFQRNFVKFGDETFEETEEIVVLPATAFELDVAPLVYEVIALSIPPRIVHPSEDECDPEVIQKLKSYSESEKPKDARWDDLTKLK